MWPRSERASPPYERHWLICCAERSGLPPERGARSFSTRWTPPGRWFATSATEVSPSAMRRASDYRATCESASATSKRTGPSPSAGRPSAPLRRGHSTQRERDVDERPAAGLRRRKPPLEEEVRHAALHVRVVLRPADDAGATGGAGGVNPQSEGDALPVPGLGRRHAVVARANLRRVYDERKLHALSVVVVGAGRAGDLVLAGDRTREALRAGRRLRERSGRRGGRKRRGLGRAARDQRHQPQG